MSFRIVLGDSSLASYLNGGGWWSVPLQYLLGLKGLGVDVILLELLHSSGETTADENRIHSFFDRLSLYALDKHCVLLLLKKDAQDQDPDTATVYGRSKEEFKQIIKSTDLFWNLCCHVRQPLLSLFQRKVLIDLDPGLLQVTAHKLKDSLFDHHTFLTIGKKIHKEDCEIPDLGLKWQTFTPFVFLPMWEPKPDPGIQAPFSSVTKWGWGTVKFENRLLSTAKRDAYLKYIELPRKSGRSFQLAVNMHSRGPAADKTGDSELLEKNDWQLVNPKEVASSPAAYRDYIANSRAEICCPKPIFRELKTGWFSDRSVCYLASGRPVLAEDTGFSEYLPTNSGLFAFKDFTEALSGVIEIDSNYPKHSMAAREIALEYLDSQKILKTMLSACD